MIQIGDDAPGFALQADSGELVKLSDLRGKRVILFFYPKAATPGCTRQACGFRDNFQTFAHSNARVYGISPDPPSKLAEWRKEENFPFELLSDPDHQVAEAYGAWGEKSMYGNKYMGVIRSHVVIGSDGKLEDVQIKVSPKASVERAVKFIEQSK